MAVRSLHELTVPSYGVKKNTTFYAGAPVARDLSGADAGLVRAADRSADTVANYVGIAADDHNRSGNTMILVDPVGSNYIDSSGNFVANNNGLFAGAKRAIGENMDEPITTVTNLTAGSTGYEGPRRGVGVYISQSTQLCTDQFSAVTTSSTTADAGGAATFAIGDMLTFGGGDYKGKFVKLASTSHGPWIATVDSYDSTQGMLYITLK